MARRKGQVCLLFEQVPDGTHYRAGAYSWVNVDEAEEYIEKGYAEEYNPYENEVEKEEQEPLSDIPDDFPGRTYFLQSDVTKFDDVKALFEDGDLQSVDGIGSSTEAKIENYLGE